MWSDTLKETFKHRIRHDEIILKDCSFCGNEKYNIEFNITKGVFHCWACEAKGTVRSFFRLSGLPFDEDEWEPSVIKTQTKKTDNVLLDGFRRINYKEWPRFFTARGLGESDADRYNLLTTDVGRYRKTLIIPLYEGRRLVYFVARELQGKWYRNPKVERRDIVPYFMGEKERMCLVLCEGALDAISANKVGFSSAVLLGTRLARVQIDKMKRLGFTEAIVALDGDAKKRAVKLCTLLQEHGITSRMAFMHESQDPNSLYVKDPSRLDEILMKAKHPSVAEKVLIEMRT